MSQTKTENKEVFLPVISWPASDVLDVEDFELSIPAGVSALVQVFKVPKCEAYKEGYFVAVNPTNNKDIAPSLQEPGCGSDKFTLLISVRVNTETTTDKYEKNMNNRNTIEFCHKEIVVDQTRINAPVEDKPAEEVKGE